MTSRQENNFHRNLTTVLLSVIAIFGVYSMVLLTTVNNKLNALQQTQAVQQEKINTLDKRLTKLEK